jgi:hypothetical protein
MARIDPGESVDPEMATPEQHRQMRALWEGIGLAGVDQRDLRMTLTARFLGVDFIESSTDLSRGHADVVLARLAELKDAGVPGWVAGHHPAATGWRAAGERRWRAKLPDPFGCDLLVLVNAAETRMMHYALDLDDFGPDDAGEVAARTFGDMQARLDHEDLPECVAPGCTEKGVAKFVAAELGHLAGKVYNAGDEIRMCYPHANDVFTAGEGLDSIAEWLRPDASVREPEYRIAGRYDGFSDGHIHRTRARLPRMLRPGEPT